MLLLFTNDLMLAATWPLCAYIHISVSAKRFVDIKSMLCSCDDSQQIEKRFTVKCWHLKP